MTIEDLNHLAALEQAASAAPWHILETSDSIGMSAVAVTKNPLVGKTFGALSDWDPGDVVAACLLQSEEQVASDDGKSHENAKLIAAIRNALPDLLRLARLGIATEADLARQ